MNLPYHRELPVYTTDIVVVGGGPAGIAAAVTAARLGQKVLLAELSGSLGGSGILSMVAELMNFDDGKNFLSTGFGEEVYDRLGYDHNYSRKWHNVHHEELKAIYDDLVTSAGIEVMFYTKAVDAIVCNNSISHAIFSGPNGLFAIEGKFFIDCSGNGCFADCAGAESLYGDEQGNTMSATICSLWGGVDFNRKELPDGTFIDRAFADGMFSQYDQVLPGIKANYPELGVGGGNVGHVFGVDDRNVKSLTQAMFDGRRILREYEAYYRGYVPGCERATMIRSADFIGIRESRRIVCEYMLTTDSFFTETPFHDEIGRYSYPIDIHPMTADKDGMEGFSQSVSIRHKDGESYSIPYRCLVPKGICNLLVAGRIIGTDRGMQASVRVIPCCYITGQAAGAAAAVCLQNGTTARDADIRQIQTILQTIRENAKSTRRIS